MNLFRKRALLMYGVPVRPSTAAKRLHSYKSTLPPQQNDAAHAGDFRFINTFVECFCFAGIRLGVVLSHVRVLGPAPAYHELPVAHLSLVSHLHLTLSIGTQEERRKRRRRWRKDASPLPE